MHSPSILNVPNDGDRARISWTDLKFNPVGLHQLRQFQGKFPRLPNFYEENRARFDASDIAWFAAGMHKDGDHHHSPERFHALAEALQTETRQTAESRKGRKDLLDKVRDLTFDMATLWDRSLGGTTVVLHCTGTTVPGAPLRPEFLKAHVYLPPSIVAHNPHLRKPIMGLVQHFIETIGAQTARDWSRRAPLSFGYNLDEPGNPPPNKPMTSFPKPRLNSSYYTFLGQPVTTTDAPLSSTIPLSSSHESGGLTEEAREILNLRGAIQCLEEENASLADRLAVLLSGVSIPESQLHYSAPENPEDNTSLQCFQPTIQPTTPAAKNHNITPSSGSSTQNMPVSPPPATPTRTRTTNRVATSPPMTTAHVRTPRGTTSHVITQATGLPSQPRQVDGLESQNLSQSALDMLIEIYDLQAHSTAISAIVRLAAPGTYADEFIKLGIPSKIAAYLAKASVMDMDN